MTQQRDDIVGRLEELVSSGRKLEPVAGSLLTIHLDMLEEAAAHITALDATLAAKDAEIARLREALVVADAAIKEMFRYYDGGETRGSYDGKPERNQLRKAGYATTAAIATQETEHG